MKNKMLATLALLAISILPGCGKSNNGAVTNNGYVAWGGGAGGAGGCYPAGSLGAGSALTFQGQVSPGSGLKGQIPLVGTGVSVSGSPYWRANKFGDRIEVRVDGGTMTASVTLSQFTISAAAASGGGGYYGGASNGAICAVYMNVGIYNPAINGSEWSGTMGGGQIGLLLSSGAFMTL